MFTGIISAIGTVKTVEQKSQTERAIIVKTQFSDVELGESIAVNGVCLTVASLNASDLQFFISQETYSRTNLGELKASSEVNLERALRLSDRLSGHLVQGHVDGLGQLTSVRKAGESYELVVRLPEELSKYVIEKGSITIDGISLTVNSLKNLDIYLMIIPHTWTHTTLKSKQVSQDLNIETDVIAKYILNERLIKPYAQHL